MRKSNFQILFGAAALLSFVSVQAQDEPTINPAQTRIINSTEATSQLTRFQTGARAAVNAGAKLKVFNYSVVGANDGLTYQGAVVGGNPFQRGGRTTTVPIVIIPLRIQYTGTVRNFDPTSPDNGCLGAGNTALSLTEASPIFNTVPNYTLNGVNLGNVTFPDAFQRAAFWPSISAFAPAYHLAFTTSVAPTQTISLVNGGANGGTVTFTGVTDCTTNSTAVDNPPRFGLLDINFVDAQLNTIITNLGITPDQFALFVVYRVVITSNGGCCILGYHSSDAIGNTLAPGQTYGIAEFDPGFVFGGTKDVSVLSHELLEWVNDPNGDNPAPAWGAIGQQSSCQTNLEVGDPLSGTLNPNITMPNNYTYHTQEMAFFSWFYGAPYAGAGNKYSSNGTFGGFAKLCPPGGTN